MTTVTNPGPIVQHPNRGNRALVAGPFSFPKWGATFGDTEALRVVADWLGQAGVAYDIACDSVNGIAGLDIKALDPRRYDTFVFVCGPWFDANLQSVLPRFEHCRKIGVNLSVLIPDHHGFDVLLHRDLLDQSNPDIVFSAPQSAALPVVGVILVHPQSEYGNKQRHRQVGAVVQEYLRLAEVVPVPMDTIYYENSTPTQTLAQLESLLRRVDLVISTRLHGMVFSLKNGVPVVAIDPIAGGAKVTAQAKALDWPVVLEANDLDIAQIQRAVSLCMSNSIREKVAHSNLVAQTRLGEMKAKFLQVVSS